MSAVHRRDFLGLGLGIAGLTALLPTDALAQDDKRLRMHRPVEWAFAYVGVLSPVIVRRRYQSNYPRIERIEFRYRGNLIRTLTQPPYEFNWVPTPADVGTDLFTATAFQAGTGQVIWFRSVTMQVANLPPVP
jgi:hypothetical protein